MKLWKVRFTCTLLYSVRAWPWQSCLRLLRLSRKLSLSPSSLHSHAHASSIITRDTLNAHSRPAWHTRLPCLSLLSSHEPKLSSYLATGWQWPQGTRCLECHLILVPADFVPVPAPTHPAAAPSVQVPSSLSSSPETSNRYGGNGSRAPRLQSLSSLRPG